MSRKPIISVQNLSVTYFPGKSNEVRALKGVSLEIFPGEFIVFFGPSGCGKSTLLYSIAALETKANGKIVVQDQELTTLKGRNREKFHQSTIGMIFQAFYLIPSLSVLQNVALPRMALNARRSEREERGKKLLEQFGVLAQAHKLPTELSGGQQQRVAICRSVMNDPAIILADEPVGNLDSKSSEEVMKLLRELNDKQKKTVILVSHDPSHLHHAHRVFFMRDGQIIRVQQNSNADRMQSPVVAAAQQSAGGPALEQWAKTLSPQELSSGEIGTFLRSHELVTEALTGMTTADVAKLEKAVRELLAGHAHSRRTLLRTLGQDERHGGLALDKRRTRRLAHEVTLLTGEMRHLKLFQKPPPPVADAAYATPARAAEYRRYIGRTLGMKSQRADFKNIESIILLRLQQKITVPDLLKRLTQSRKKDGAALSIMKARQFSKRLEALILLDTALAQKPTPTPSPSESPSTSPTSPPVSPAKSSSQKKIPKAT